MELLVFLLNELHPQTSPAQETAIPPFRLRKLQNHPQLFFSYPTPHPSEILVCLIFKINLELHGFSASPSHTQIAWIFAKPYSSFPVSAHIRFSLVSIKQANDFISASSKGSLNWNQELKIIPTADKFNHDLSSYYHFPATLITHCFLISFHTIFTPGCSAPSGSYSSVTSQWGLLWPPNLKLQYLPLTMYLIPLSCSTFPTLF